MPLSSVRYPRVAVLANGRAIPGVVEAQVVSCNYHAADRFSVTASLSADSRALGFWASTPAAEIDIQMSLDGVGFVSLLQGQVDLVEIDQISGRLRIEGRDFTAPLIETKTQETFSNRTSSEIAEILASRHGLQPVITATDTPVGRYYQGEHDRITLDQFSRATTEWDLLAFLAQQEGFDVFVSGRALYFQPPSTLESVLTITPASVADLRLERALMFARDLEVTVKSWNARQNNAFTQTARASGRGASLGGGGKAQRYVFVRPNLTSDQALKLAQQKLAELTRYERVISAVMPGELAITPRTLISLVGTGSAFDQMYYVDSIERSLHCESGFLQHLRCKNMRPGSEATPPADIVAAVTG